MTIEDAKDCPVCDECCKHFWGEMNYRDDRVLVMGGLETLLADEWTFCPNCGRRLTDD